MRPVAFLFGNNPSVFLDLQPASPVRPVFFFLSFVVGKKKKKKNNFIIKNVFVRFILLYLRVSYFFASMSNYAIHLGPVCLFYLLLRRVWPACAPFFFILHVYYTHITDILSLTWHTQRSRQHIGGRIAHFLAFFKCYDYNTTPSIMHNQHIAADAQLSTPKVHMVTLIST